MLFQPRAGDKRFMKAVYIERHGGNEVLQIGELPRPVPGPGEVLVRLFAVFGAAIAACSILSICTSDEQRFGNLSTATPVRRSTVLRKRRGLLYRLI